MIAVKAHYDGKVIVPDEPVDLPKDRALVVHVELVRKAGRTAKPKGKSDKSKKGKSSKPKGQSLLEWAKENAVLDDPLPTDLGHQHDHYLYGTPKKPPAQS